MELITHVIIFCIAYWALLVVTRPIRTEMHRTKLRRALAMARRARNVERVIQIQDELYHSDAEQAFKLFSRR